jgi:hypothetical protein
MVKACNDELDKMIPGDICVFILKMIRSMETQLTQRKSRKVRGSALLIFILLATVK